MGTYPLGALLVGWLADLYGSPMTIIICAVVISLVFGMINLKHPSIRKFN
jgi:MFS family permease